MPDLSQHVLGETETPVALETSDDCREAALALAEQGNRTMLIFTHDLDPKVYNNAAFVDAVSALARRHHLSWVRVLVQDPGRAIRSGHRLVELALRLSSRVQIRTVGHQYRSYNRSFLIVDDTGLLLRESAIRYEGTVNFNAHQQAREYAHFFHKVWDVSAPDPNLARLHL